jgi:hypothetical protein
LGALSNIRFQANKPSLKPFLKTAWLETRMDKRSARGVLEEWRVYCLSGQVPCRTPIGAAFKGGRFYKGICET